MRCYLMYAGTAYPQYEQFDTLQGAKAEFFRSATELMQYDQHSEASLHIASSEDQINEYPDYVLSLGPKGGLKCERT